MSRIISLLEEKNHYLEKFYTLGETHMPDFLRGNFDFIDYFYNSREKILEIIRYIDQELEGLQSTDLVTDANRDRVQEAYKIKDLYVKKILEQDVDILACIEATKNNIIKELHELKRGRKAVGNYKVKTFAKRIEEEA